MKIENENKYSEDYNEDGFWEKVKNFAKDAGKEVIEKALQLYYVLDKKDVPMAIKTIIWGALAYFVSPIDAIPDVLPSVGYTDDLGVLAAALVAVSQYIDEGVKKKARKKLEEWFE